MENILFFLFKTGFHYVALAVLDGTDYGNQASLELTTDMPATASIVLGLKACNTRPGSGKHPYCRENEFAKTME